MAYMRGEWYIYWDVGGFVRFTNPDGETYDVPGETMEELALMVASEIVDDEKNFARVSKRIMDKHGGNIGAETFDLAAGRGSFIEQVKAAVHAMDMREASDE